MLKAGTYYVGDLCYVLNEDNDFDWDDVLEKTNYFGDGVGGYFEYKGIKFFCSSTQYGDGEYPDNHGNSYGVDAGIIGAFPVEKLKKPDGDGLGALVIFDSDFNCLTCDKNGVIKIGHLSIMTGFDEDEGY